MDSFAAAILAFIKTNPGWAIFVIGLTAFGESFVFLSLLFPGTTILIAAGALISKASLILFPPQAQGSWVPFLEAHPERLAHGIRFFGRYGETSVFIGRFFGPLRAVAPLSAGMMNMPTGRFYVANILSAMIWAPSLIYLGDRLSHTLGPDGLATKVLYITLAAASLTVLASWIRRQFLVR